MGRTRTASLDAWHHLSFAQYQDRRWDRLGALRVLNHAVLAPRSELRPQPIDGVDIIVFVRRGVLEHLGATTEGRRTVAGEVRLISSASGIEHGLYNPGAQPAEYVEFRLQTDRRLERPCQKVTAFPTRDCKDRLFTLATGFPEDRAGMPLHAPARVAAMRVRGGHRQVYSTRSRQTYILCVAGRIQIDAIHLAAGDAAIIRRASSFTLHALAGSEVVLVETE